MFINAFLVIKTTDAWRVVLPENLWNLSNKQKYELKIKNKIFKSYFCLLDIFHKFSGKTTRQAPVIKTLISMIFFSVMAGTRSGIFGSMTLFLTPVFSLIMHKILVFIHAFDFTQVTHNVFVTFSNGPNLVTLNL